MLVTTHWGVKKFLIRYFCARPRTFFGLIALGVVLLLLSQSGLEWCFIFILTAMWGTALLLGANWRTVIANTSEYSYAPSWSIGLLFSLIILAATARLLLSNYFWQILAAFTPAYAICYAGSKIRCYYVGCCRWKRTKNFPLELFECTTSFAVSFLCTFLCLKHYSVLAVLIFFTIHGLTRLLNAFRKPVTKPLHIDGFVLCAISLLITFSQTQIW